MTKNLVKFALATILAALALSASTAILAVESPPSTRTGTVKAVSADGKEITVSVAGEFNPGQEMQFRLTTRTKVMLVGKSGIEKGMKVRITYDRVSKDPIEITSESALTGSTKAESANKETGNDGDKADLVLKCQELCKKIGEEYKRKNATVKAKTPRIAVLDFSDQAGQVTHFGWLLAEELTTNSVASDDFTVVERNQLKKAMVDSKLTAEGFVAAPKEAAKKLGNILRADAVIFGTVADWGGSFRVNARLLSTDTGELVAAAATTVKYAAAATTGGGEPNMGSNATTTKQAVSEPDRTGIRIVAEKVVKHQNVIEVTMAIKNDSDTERFVWLDRTDATAGDVSLLSNSGKKWSITTATNFELEGERSARFNAAGRNKFNGFGRYRPGEVKQQKLTFSNTDDPTGEEFEFRGTFQSSAEDPFREFLGTYYFQARNAKAVEKVIKRLRTSTRPERQKPE